MVGTPEQGILGLTEYLFTDHSEHTAVITAVFQLHLFLVISHVIADFSLEADTWVPTPLTLAAVPT